MQLGEQAVVVESRDFGFTVLQWHYKMHVMPGFNNFEKIEHPERVQALERSCKWNGLKLSPMLHKIRAYNERWSMHRNDRSA